MPLFFKTLLTCLLYTSLGQQLPPGGEGAGQVLKEEGAEPAGFGLGVDAHLSLGDHAQSALGADENLIQVWARGVLGHRGGVDNVAVGKDDLHAQAHVIDLAVFGGNHADAPMGQKAAQSRAVLGAGICLLYTSRCV